MWIYETKPWIGFLAVFAILLLCSYAGFWLGSRWEGATPEGNRRHLPEVVPATVRALLVLILGFTFSMTVGRFEKRRQLVIDEANAIGTIYLRTQTLHPPEGPRIAALLRVYLDRRIEYYEALVDVARRQEVQAQVASLQKQIWFEIVQLTQRERTAIESTFLNLLNTTFDLERERTIVLTKTLPQMIYLYILFVAAIGVATLNFVRGQRKEAGQWQPFILILIISLTISVILDLDRPVEGRIRITQEAMISLRDSINQK